MGATEDLAAAERSSVIDVCIAAHGDEDFQNLFSYVPSGGRHFQHPHARLPTVLIALGYDPVTRGHVRRIKQP